MDFNWINWGNIAAVACLVIINLVAAGKGVSEDFRSRYPAVNFFEQMGRYGCMALMIFPVFAKGWEFGFASVRGMLVWAIGNVLLLAVYGWLWTRKSTGDAGILYGLAIVPVMLFLLDGILLRILCWRPLR